MNRRSAGHSLLKPRAMGGVMFICYAVKPLRDEARLHAASTPTVEAALAAEYDNDFAELDGHDTYPAARAVEKVWGRFIRKMRHGGEPHPSALSGA